MKLSRASRRDQPARRSGEREARPASDLSKAPQFRRNQTLSGIRREAQVEAASPRAQIHALTRRRRRVGGMLLLILVGCMLLGLLVTQLTARVVIAGSADPLNSSPDASIYEKAINDYFGLHPVERLRFVLNEDGISQYVAGLAPEVSRVTQSSSENFTDTHFTLAFRHPVAGWQINGKQYYVDDQGVVFEKNYYDDPGVQIVDESGVSPEQGSTVASARLLSFVGRVVALSKESGRVVNEVLLPVGTTRQLDIRLKGVKPRIKFTIDRAVGEQVEDMDRALDYLSRRNIKASYLDVRVAGRAVYK